VLLGNQLATERWLDDSNTSVQIIQIARDGADCAPRFTCRRSNRVPALRASLMNLRLGRRNDLLSQRLANDFRPSMCCAPEAASTTAWQSDSIQYAIPIK
jgi:hypothetical protein